MASYIKVMPEPATHTVDELLAESISPPSSAEAQIRVEYLLDTLQLYQVTPVFKHFPKPLAFLTHSPKGPVAQI